MFFYLLSVLPTFTLRESSRLQSCRLLKRFVSSTNIKRPLTQFGDHVVNHDDFRKSLVDPSSNGHAGKPLICPLSPVSSMSQEFVFQSCWWTWRDRESIDTFSFPSWKLSFYFWYSHPVSSVSLLLRKSSRVRPPCFVCLIPGYVYSPASEIK